MFFPPTNYLKRNVHPIAKPNGNSTQQRLSSIGGIKYILLWRELWGYKFGLGRAPFVDAGCRVNRCYITYNASLMPSEDFDAILVHPPTQRNPRVFENRRPDQIFVMFSNEPPVHMPDLMNYENYFNWTMTHRNGSDFHLKYGEILPLETAPTTDEEARKLRNIPSKTFLDVAKRKTKMAVWMVSNCQTLSNRRLYVAILKKYIDVDIISKGGLCGGKDICPRSQNYDVCYNMIEEKYKFYLSFENSICEEYVTEKFFEMMARNVVPIVLGGANYSSIAPQHSYINALDYTPHELADYLKKLDNNDTLYAEYFWWKPHYRVRNLFDTSKEAFCNLCEALHKTPVKQQTVRGLNAWYMKGARCLNKPKFKRN